jgi:hypothetical protein
MQFILSTWPLVAVDGDGDGVRDPQDIDDALAAAVYLCSSEEGVSTTKGQRAALARYNRSEAYVATVLKIAKGYSDSPYGSDDIELAAAPAHAEPSPTARGPKAKKTDEKKPGKNRSSKVKPNPKPSDGAKPGAATSASPSTAPAPSPTPTDDGSWASRSERRSICTAELSSRFPDLTEGWDTNRAVDSCSTRLIGKTVTESNTAVPGIVTDITGYVEWLIDTLP